MVGTEQNSLEGIKIAERKRDTGKWWGLGKGHSS